MSLPKILQEQLLKAESQAEKLKGLDSNVFFSIGNEFPALDDYQDWISNLFIDWFENYEHNQGFSKDKIDFQDESSFCGQVGDEYIPQCKVEFEYLCPQCDESVPANAEICPNCGFDFNSDQ